MIKEGEGNMEDVWYTMRMASQMARGVCDDHSMCEEMIGMDMMMEPQCNIQMADRCVKYADMTSLIGSVDILGWDLVCR